MFEGSRSKPSMERPPRQAARLVETDAAESTSVDGDGRDPAHRLPVADHPGGSLKI